VTRPRKSLTFVTGPFLKIIENHCAKPSLQNQFPKNSNRSRQLAVRTMHDSALCLCGARRLYYFYNVTKPWLSNVYNKIVMVCRFIRCCLFENCYAAPENKKKRTQIANKDIS